jgi:hypothetical protein
MEINNAAMTVLVETRQGRRNRRPCGWSARSSRALAVFRLPQLSLRFLPEGRALAIIGRAH